MKKKLFLGVAMLIICSPLYGIMVVFSTIKRPLSFYADVTIFFGLIIVFAVFIVLGLKICKKLKLWIKQ
jgi:hypothetical protein